MLKILGFGLLAALLALPAGATVEFAERTDQDCGVCHRDPAGGGALTATGEAFVAGGYRWPPSEAAGARTPSRSAHLLRVALGFVHLTTAVVWFGTIFYVHLVLRPRYAVGGLPRTEMRIAWVSVLLLAVTGIFLTVYRFPSLTLLTESRSGQLLLAKVGLFLFLVLSAAVACVFLSPRLRKLKAPWQHNDGREGRPAWVVVRGRAYDVSESPAWKEGSHFRRHQAGNDLTDALAGAPHGAEKLEPFDAMALGDAEDLEKAPEVLILYVMAYVNLLVAVGILLVISVWRWG